MPDYGDSGNPERVHRKYDSRFDESKFNQSEFHQSEFHQSKLLSDGQHQCGQRPGLRNGTDESPHDYVGYAMPACACKCRAAFYVKSVSSKL
jgi:hypothetical protein